MNAVDDSFSFLANLSAILEKHYSEEGFDIKRLDELLCMSRSQVHRKLKELTGLSPGRFLMQFRLNKALGLLLGTDLNIQEISFQTGFKSPSYFSRAFQKTFLHTPRLMRQLKAKNATNVL
jgi:AraC-like DNA-binding protein